MSKKLEALVATLEKKGMETVAVIHDNGPAGPNVVAFIDVDENLSLEDKRRVAVKHTTTLGLLNWWESDFVTPMFDGDGARSTMPGRTPMPSSPSSLKA